MQIFRLHYLAILFFGFLQFLEIKGGKILIFAYHDSGSHFLSMSPFFTSLANSGHQVFLFDTIFNKTRFNHPNVTHLHFTIPRHSTPSEFIWQNYVDSIMMIRAFTDPDITVLGALTEKYQKEINQLLSQKWDLVIADALFVPHAHAIASRLLQEQGTPFLLYETACQLEEWQMTMQAMGWNPVAKLYPYFPPNTHPDKHYDPQRFYDRLRNFAHSAFQQFTYYYLEDATYFPNVEKFGVDRFHYWDFLQKPVLTFAERIDWMGWIMPMDNNLIDIGANCPKISSELTDDLKEFIEKPGSLGTIYIAFGSYANWSAALPNVVDSFVFTFQKIPPHYQIIFSYNGPEDKMPKLPNLKLVKWAPQTAILRHPKTILFVSHGGLKSTKETLCAGVPILALPLFAEQPYTADTIVKEEIGRVLNKHNVDGQQMLGQVKELLHNPKYTKNIQRFRQIYTDRLIPSLELAKWHVDHTIRSTHQHFAFNKKKGATKSWFEYFNLDVLGLFLIAVLFCV